LIWAIIRKTLGWNKEFDQISYSQFETVTGIKRPYIWRTLKRLAERNIIIPKCTGQRIEYQLQKDYELWNKPVPVEGLVPSEDKPVPVEGPKPVPVEGHTKDKKKTNKGKYGELANVLLTDTEYQKLIEKFGSEDAAKDRIENLSLYKKSKGKPYKDDYATILAWDRNDQKKQKQVAASANNPCQTEGCKNMTTEEFCEECHILIIKRTNELYARSDRA
jgi:hypothetical protein